MSSNRDRLPPGQIVTSKFPAMFVGDVQQIKLSDWDLRIFGLVESQTVLKWDDFVSLPKLRVTSDFHCVTSWSRLDNHWEGVSFRNIMNLVDVLPDAKFVVVHGQQDYLASFSIEELLEEGVIFASHHDGKKLSAEHGFPVRLVVPHLYAWKSVKWVRGVEFAAEAKQSFWEKHGYHSHGNPWMEERYANSSF